MLTELDFAARKQKPYSTTGLIVSTWADGTTTLGTCCVVGRNDILTALHTVYSPAKGGSASRVNFYFGTDFNQTTGQLESVLYRPNFTQWTIAALPDKVYADADNNTMLQSESAYDVALIGIDIPVGDSLGWLDLAPDYQGSQSALSIGYPLGATGMMQESVTVTRNSTWGIYSADEETMGAGSSGGPLLINNAVAGIKSTAASWAAVGIPFLRTTLQGAITRNDNLLETVINGGAADETFLAGISKDRIDGGSGIDTVSYTGKHADYTLSHASAIWTLSSATEGTDTLSNIERLQFADKKLALDLTPAEPAGQTLEFIGLMAPELIHTPVVVGTILALFDQGKSLPEVCQLAIDVGLLKRLAGADGNTALVALAYRNVIGVEPEAAEIDRLLAYMDGRQASLSPADFMATVAGLEVNHLHIGLIGLQRTGIEFA